MTTHYQVRYLYSVDKNHNIDSLETDWVSMFLKEDTQEDF